MWFYCNKKKQINNYTELIDKLKIIKNGNVKKNTNEPKDNININIKSDETKDINDNNCLSEKSEKIIDKTNIDLQNILNTFGLKDISKDNIFIILTNGSYLLFKIVFDTTNELLKKDDFDENYLKKQIEKYDNILKNLTDSKKIYLKKLKIYIIFFEI